MVVTEAKNAKLGLRIEVLLQLSIPIVIVTGVSVEGSFMAFVESIMSRAIAAMGSVWFSFLTGAPLTAMYSASPSVSNCFRKTRLGDRGSRGKDKQAGN